MHVLSFAVLEYLENKFSGDPNGLAANMDLLFDHSYLYNDPTGQPYYRCSALKFTHVNEGEQLARLPSEHARHPLNMLLHDLAELCKRHYRTPKIQQLLPRPAEILDSSPDVDASTWDKFTAEASMLGFTPPPSPGPSREELASQHEGDDATGTESSPLEDYEWFIEVFRKHLAMRDLWLVLKRQPGTVANTTR